MVPREDARYILPNACETKLVVTMNARSLPPFFSGTLLPEGPVGDTEPCRDNA